MSKVAARTVQTPGEAPPQDQPKPDAYTANVIQTGQEGDAEPSEVDRLRAMVERQGEQMANMMAAMQNMARSQAGAPKPAAAESVRHSDDLFERGAPHDLGLRPHE